MRALVTGAAGFIGSNLAAELSARGWHVVGIDSFTDYYDYDIKLANVERIQAAGCEFRRRDILDTGLDEVLTGVDAIFHQAGQPGVRKSWGSEFADYVSANVAATQVLLEATKNSAPGARFVYASSSSVYGEAETFPTTELSLPAPRSPYGVTKLAAEHLCSLYGANFKLKTVSLRYFTVYGPGQRPDMAFTRFVRAAVTGNPIHIFGDGTQVRDFTFVDDIVGANILAAETDLQPGTVMNVSGGTNASVNDVLEYIRQMINSELDVRYVDPVHGDVFRTGGDSTRARTLLNWVPSVSLQDGLRAQLEWARRTSGGAYGT